MNCKTSTCSFIAFAFTLAATGANASSGIPEGASAEEVLPKGQRGVIADVVSEVRGLLPKGWRLDPNQVTFRFLTTRELENYLRKQDGNERTRTPSHSNTLQQADSALLAEFYSTRAKRAEAVYLFDNKTLVVNKDKWKRLSTSKRRALLGHELVHAAQQQNHPRLSMKKDTTMVLMEAQAKEIQRTMELRADGVTVDNAASIQQRYNRMWKRRKVRETMLKKVVPYGMPQSATGIPQANSAGEDLRRLILPENAPTRPPPPPSTVSIKCHGTRQGFRDMRAGKRSGLAPGKRSGLFKGRRSR